MKRQVVIAMTDEHAGSIGGLQNPETVLSIDEEVGRVEPVTPTPSAFQLTTWGYFESDLLGAFEFAGSDKVHVIKAGDVTQGNRLSDGCKFTRMADQVELALWNTLPILEFDNVASIRIDRGTGWHSFGEGSSEQLLASLIKGARPELDVKTVYHGLSIIDGVRIDHSHHGPGTGSRDWLQGNTGRYYLKDAVAKHRRNRDDNPPDVFIRGHVHGMIYETLHEVWRGKMCDYHLLTVPGYCGIGDYGRKATKSTAFQQFGLVAFEIIDGEVGRIKNFFRTIDTRRWEEI